MKKVFLYIAMAAAALGFTACEDDKEPIYHDPTEFVLNTPALAEQYYELRKGGTVELTCSQPDYGFAAETNYSVEVALNDRFVADSTFTVKGKPATSATITLQDADLNQPLLKLLNIKSYGDFPVEGVKPVTLYMRAHASLKNVESSAITSNTIELKHVIPYNPYSPTGRTIYFIGSPQEWNINGASLKIVETGVSTDLYMGVVDIPAGEQLFRFYTELGDWNTGSIGTSNGENIYINISEDQPLEMEMKYDSQGCWMTPADWKGGKVTFWFDMKGEEPVMKVQEGDYDPSNKPYIYLVGACSAWAVTDADGAEKLANYKLYDWKFNGVYTNTFEVAKGTAMFRFYSELGDWDIGSIGSQVDDAPVDFDFTGDTFESAFVNGGKGNWNFPNWEGGKMNMTVDTNTDKVVFKIVE